eukprot:Nitzschia sp. Nitz4//scaffold32_size149145//139255//142862//NITZ4_002902-RA/size149145-augustus-gene-0.44-mRNA-1//1//CDS//3329548138//1455//frame0
MIPPNAHKISNESEFSTSSENGDNTINDATTRSKSESTMNTNRIAEREDIDIARHENKAVYHVRIAVAAFMLLCTTGAALLVFFGTKKQEQKDIEQGLQEFSTTIFGSLATTFDHSLAVADSLALTLVSYAESTNMTWPFVTIPHSGPRFAKALSMTKSTSVGLLPYVEHALKDEWNAYSNANAPTWIDENIRIQANYEGYYGEPVETYYTSDLWYYTGIPVEDHDYYVPFWQSYPTTSYPVPIYNFDYISPTTPDTYLRGNGPKVVELLQSGKCQISDIANEGGGYNAAIDAIVAGTFDSSEPLSEIHYPIFKTAVDDIFNEGTDNATDFVGFLFLSFYWRNLMLDMLPEGVDGLVVVATTTCNTSFSYEINGPSLNFLGFGDHHDSEFDDMFAEASYSELHNFKSGVNVYSGLDVSEDLCAYNFRVYPSKQFESLYETNTPAVYTVVTVAIFLFTSCVFMLYDWFVEQRQRRVMSAAVKSSAIVSSLFPKNVRERLFNLENNANTRASPKIKLKSFISDENPSSKNMDDASTEPTSQPIADLFPDATVMFGDIASFTSWSSTREPSQVFILLETVYGAFDKLAARRGVFKVETIGDSYVAVAGLPDPRDDHAVVMARFAHDCCLQMHKLMAKLSVTLGPDTEDLTMRFGLNSGPVTAGVLRGQKSRFQLFGDTVNTASRMESTGERNRIQVSQSTADELIKHNKGHWVTSRLEEVAIKGKGMMTTYWVIPRNGSGSSVGADERQEMSPKEHRMASIVISESKISRLVDWNTDVLLKLLLGIVKLRVALRDSSDFSGSDEEGDVSQSTNGIPIDEVREVIELPQYLHIDNLENVEAEIEPDVKSLLRDYVSAIADTYHADNPFHNFEHASHMCMSVAKLMSRIVAVDDFYEQQIQDHSIERFKHDRTFGIASDPLTLFACAFSALVHDVDHPGVPNTTLVNEQTEDAKKYNSRSVAEQHSVDVAWELLMLDKFKPLRGAICDTPKELARFRHLVVNGVLATDIMDKELKKLRNSRWEKAFDVSLMNSRFDARDVVNRKATIVFEHLLQASDVAHTMQHWHVFRKWNERLFAEMTRAYEEGRSDKNPVDFWYKGELGFFDFYIIPLAKKLSDCGVFGVSSDEYLNYAIKNREEWEQKGEQLVKEMANNWCSGTEES